MKRRLKNRPAIALLLFVVLSLQFACKRDFQADDLGVFGKTRMDYVLGQDGVASIPFDNRLYIWTFGDTILGTWKGSVSAGATFSEKADIETMLPNSMAFSEVPTSRNIKKLDFTFYRRNGRIVRILHPLPGEDPGLTRLWAMDGIRLGNRVYLYYLHIHIDEPGKAFGFSLRGTGLARWDIPDGWKMGDRVDFRRVARIFNENEPAFGGGVIEKDGYIYATGQFTVGDMQSFLRIMRVPVEGIENRKDYRFLARGGEWICDIENSLALFGDVAGEATISYNKDLDRFIIIHCRLKTGRVAITHFKEFSGLDNPQTVDIYSPPRLHSTGKEYTPFYYSGKEIFSEGREIYAIYINPLEYQPYLLRIKYLPRK